MLLGLSRKPVRKTPVYTLEQVAQHTKQNDIWMVIHGKVYDVTFFLTKHPGGAEILLDCAGIDATQYFEDVGHSEDSKLLLPPLFKGDLAKEDYDTNTNSNRLNSTELKICSYPGKLFNNIWLSSSKKSKTSKKLRSKKYRTSSSQIFTLLIVAVTSALMFVLLQKRKWQ